jgi:hypothetical protein
MQVLIINPNTKEIKALEISNTKEALQEVIGFATIDSDEIDDNGDRLFFDEECFIRQQSVGRFKVDSLAPVAGIGVIVNSNDLGNPLQSAIVTIADLEKRVTFL